MKNATAGGSLVELIKILLEVDTSSVDADLNATTINDNSGGRIIL